jgi:hypothetical protein
MKKLISIVSQLISKKINFLIKDLKTNRSTKLVQHKTTKLIQQVKIKAVLLLVKIKVLQRIKIKIKVVLKNQRNQN